MRIGELASLLGVSTRTVRHYHHQGVLPEPSRRANGYREYGVRDAIALARVRRLVDLGLSLEEAGDILRDDRARDLPEILGEIDADLARREQEIRVKRSRLADLLRQAEVGALGPDDTASPELVAFLREVDVPSSKSAAWDRDLLVLLDSMAPAHELDAPPPGTPHWPPTLRWRPAARTSIADSTNWPRPSRTTPALRLWPRQSPSSPLNTC
jgi:DNA-binding transcriptional MerR regulator